MPRHGLLRCCEDDLLGQALVILWRGPEGIRTPDLTRARGALYQLSYWP
jgi:hypothetical protein